MINIGKTRYTLAEAKEAFGKKQVMLLFIFVGLAVVATLFAATYVFKLHKNKKCCNHH